MTFESPTIFDALAAARETADEKIRQVTENASDRWKDAALEAVRRLAATGRPFTSDDVWTELGDTDPDDADPRALGGVFRAASRRGLVRKTGGFAPSVRRHGTPIVVWTGTGQEDRP